MRNVHTQIKPGALTVLLFAQLGFAAHAAPPDAGQTMRELQQQPELTAPKEATPLRIEGEPAPKAREIEDVRMVVKAIRVSGSSVFTAGELEALLADLIGGEHSLAELVDGAARITAYYRERGYVVVRAYLPPQEIRDGAVLINVLEGRLGEQRIHNQSRLSDQRASGYLSDIKSGDVLQAAPVDRAILLLNDTPGVGMVRATLQPGASVGTADMLVELDPSVPYAANIELDNGGNYYTGEYRIGAELLLNSPLATYPFIRSQASNLSGILSWEDKQLKDQKDAVFITSDKQVQLLSLGLNGNHQDALCGAGITSFDLMLVSGRLSMDAGASDPFSLFQYEFTQSDGAYTRLAYNFNRVQRLTDTDSISGRLSGQRASRNLNSSEQFSLGGSNGVRAYPQGEAGGDHGWLLNLELRHSFAPALQGAIFYDVGSVEINRYPYLAGDNTRTISGAGIGANADLAGVLVKTYLAWRTDGGTPVSEPGSLDRNPRLWLQLTKRF